MLALPSGAGAAARTVLLFSARGSSREADGLWFDSLVGHEDVVVDEGA